jgi:D-alanyl-D-alanine carboxypeptidase
VFSPGICDVIANRLAVPALAASLFVTLVVTASASFRVQPAAPLRDRLQAAFAELHRAGSFPGGTAGVALADGTSFAIAVGVSDRETKAPMKPSDRLLLGSVGKTYVSAVALQLVREGKLGLDDPIARHLGNETWFPKLPNAAAMTVRQLMNHTSGLVRYELNPKFTADLTANPDRIWTVEDRLSYLFGSTPPFAPGGGWEYSDTNYIVLGAIIERVGGASYYEQLGRRILRPLSLNDTVPADSRRVPGLVQGYAGENNPFGGRDAMIENGRLVISPQFEWTGGGLAVTAGDLARWAKLLYEGKVVDASLMDDLLDGVPARLGPETRYGLGVIIRPTARGVTYGHSGFMPGYQTDVMYFPSLGAAIAVQVNSSAAKATGRPLRAFLTEFAQVIAGAAPK